jgi:putative iron-regulated protein
MALTQTRTFFAIGAALLAGCGSNEVTEREVLESYAALVHANYQEALTTARGMQTAIDAFVASPSAASLAAAKDAWLAARRPYGQTEAFRFYSGPIDDDDGPEGQLNAWPLDEAYVDYVEGAPNAGIINDTSIEITKERLASLNEGGEGDIVDRGGGEFDAEAAVSTGYHAVEFLLWGQDRSDSGPGERSFEDYTSAPNADRRGLYLKTVAALIVEDLERLTAEWDPNAPTSYRNATFLAAGSEQQMLKNVVAAIGILSKGELGGERMDVALDTNDQEDEHSCFSDNTHVDIEMNALGIQNVFLGRYGSVAGPSIHDLVHQNDEALAEEIETMMETSLERIRAIPKPFDQAIKTPMSPQWSAVNDAVDALFDQGDRIAAIGPALGLGTISVELPE